MKHLFLASQETSAAQNGIQPGQYLVKPIQLLQIPILWDMLAQRVLCRNCLSNMSQAGLSLARP